MTARTETAEGAAAGTPRMPAWVPAWVPSWVDRQAAIVAALALVFLVVQVATWSPVADGPRARYVKAAVIGAGAALGVWWLVRLQVRPGSVVPVAAAAAVLLGGSALHGVRLAHPISRGAPVAGVTSAFGAGEAALRAWEVETAGGGRAAVQGGVLLLESPPRGSAFVRPRLAALPDVSTHWWLPHGLAVLERTEALTWRAALERTGGYYVLAELRNLLVQAVSYGVHITYPDERGALRGFEVQHPAGSDGQVHDWRLERRRGQTALSIDGKQVWAQPARGELTQVRLGETKSDPDHGGRMRVESAAFVVALERP